MSSQSKDNTCPTCRGFGAVPKSGYVPKENATHKTCPTCHGSGQQEDTLTSQPPSPQSSPLDNVSESSRTPEQETVQVPKAILDLLVELASEGQMDAFNNGEVTNPELMEQSGKVYKIAHWYASPDCRKNHRSWNPEAHEALPSRETSESDQSPSHSEQEDKPYTVEPQKLMDGCHKCKAVFPAGEQHSCDSKPEKPLEQPQWDDFSIELAKRKGLIHPDTAKELTEPSKPDQLDLAQIIIDAGQPWGLDENEAFFDALPAVKEALEALISQREQSAYDRGVKDGKAAGSLAAFLEIKAYGSYALDRQYCDEPFIVVPVSELDEAISVFGDELKSKGEVK